MVVRWGSDDGNFWGVSTMIVMVMDIVFMTDDAGGDSLIEGWTLTTWVRGQK